MARVWDQHTLGLQLATLANPTKSSCLFLNSARQCHSPPSVFLAQFFHQGGMFTAGSSFLTFWPALTSSGTPRTSKGDVLSERNFARVFAFCTKTRLTWNTGFYFSTFFRDSKVDREKNIRNTDTYIYSPC